MRTSLVSANAVKGRSGDTGALTAYSRYLMMKAQIAGNLRFDGHSATDDERVVARQCRELSDRIARRLNTCKEGDIADLLDCYDIVYRIGNDALPDRDFMCRHKHRAFMAWKSGVGDVAESAVFGMIAPEVKYQRVKAREEYVDAYLMILKNWIDTLGRHDTFLNVTAVENYRRLALVMKENLGSDFHDAKLRWYKNNCVNDLSTLGTQILRSYQRFINSITTDILDFDEKMSIDQKIITELSTRTDLDPHDRLALRLAHTHHPATVEFL